MKKNLRSGTGETYLPSTVDEIPNDTDLNKLHRENLYTYINNLDKKFNTPGELNADSLIEKPIEFAKTETLRVADKTQIYFKKEICDLELLLGKSIVYMIDSSLNNHNNAQNMLSIDRTMLDKFIEILIEMDVNNEFSCNVKVWNYLLKNLTPVKSNDPDQQLNLQKMEPMMPIVENLIENADDPEVKDILKRDYYALFFPIIKQNWSQEDLNQIPPEIF